MRLLLDTVTFLWATLDARRCSTNARKALEASDNELFVSVVTAWEIGVKHATGRLDLPHPPDRLVPEYIDRMGVIALPLELEPALRAGRLPRLHDDPFDRMLVCQAIEHGLTIVTPDEAIRQYPVPTVW